MHIHSITINCWSIEYCSSVFSVSVVIYQRQSVTCLVAQSLMSDIMIHSDGRARVQACDRADQTHGLKKDWCTATFTLISHHTDWHATVQCSVLCYGPMAKQTVFEPISVLWGTLEKYCDVSFFHLLNCNLTGSFFGSTYNVVFN